MGSTIEVDSGKVMRFKKSRAATVRLLASVVPKSGLLIAGLLWVGLSIFGPLRGTETAPTALGLAIVSFVLFVLAADVYSSLTIHFLRLDHSGVRRLHWRKGFIETPWAHVRYVELEGKRCRLEDARNGREIGELDFEAYESPGQVFDFIVSRMGREVVEGAICARMDQSLRRKPQPLSVRILGTLLGFSLGFCMMYLVSVALVGPGDNPFLPILGVAGALLIGVSWMHINKRIR